MFPGWEKIVRRLRVSRPGPASTDIHGARRVGSSKPGRQIDQHPEPQFTDRSIDGPTATFQGEKESPTHPPYHPGRVLKCPVCGLDMKVRYLGRIEIDQCSQCSGVFLDRGELQELTHVDASSFQASATRRDALIYTPHGLTSHVWEHSHDKPGAP